MNIFYRYYKKKNRPVIIITHGLGVDHNFLGDLTKHFKRKYSVLTWDLNGHGKSDGSLDLNLFIKSLNNIIEKEKITNPVLIGHSLGGYVSAIYSSRHPTKVKKLILINAPYSMEISTLLKLVFSSVISFKGENRIIAAVKKKYPNYKLIRLLFQRIITRARKISIPTVLIISKQDEIVLPKNSIRYAEKIKDCRVILVEGTHNVPRKDPKKIISIIEKEI